MSRQRFRHLRRSVVVLALGGAAVATLGWPSPARAWWRGGGLFIGIPGPFVFGPPVVYPPPPVVYPPPAYYYPPSYYARPPVPYAPPSPYPPASGHAGQPGRTCYAGGYTCPLAGSYPPGAACSCPTGRAPAHGRAG